MPALMVCYIDFMVKVGEDWYKGSTRVPELTGTLLRSADINVYQEGINAFAPHARGSLERNKKCTEFPHPFDHRTLFPLDIRGPYELKR